MFLNVTATLPCGARTDWKFDRIDEAEEAMKLAARMSIPVLCEFNDEDGPANDSHEFARWIGETLNMDNSPEPLTVAYMAIGAQQALQNLLEHHPDLLEKLVDSHGGQLGVVDRVVSYAGLLDGLTYSVDFYAYDICEPFGARLVVSMATAPGMRIDDSDALRIALDVIEEAQR